MPVITQGRRHRGSHRGYCAEPVVNPMRLILKLNCNKALDLVKEVTNVAVLHDIVLAFHA